MMPDCKKSKTGQLNSKDRLSDLPDFILHNILSYLRVEEAYRISLLSKRWTQISATNPVLEFHGSTARNLEYLDTRMQLYSKEKLLITTLTLRLPTISLDLALACKFREWFEIAVRNQLVKFDFTGPVNYKVPPILFSAKLLRRLACSNVEIPYYGSVDLVSLESLVLSGVIVEERMLCHIVSSCRLLTELILSNCYGFKNLVIPRHSKLEILAIDGTLPLDGRVFLETSSLGKFQYTPKSESNYPWPMISNGGLLRNLWFLSVTDLSVTDEALAVVLLQLPSLEILFFLGMSQADEYRNIEHPTEGNLLT